MNETVPNAEAPVKAKNFALHTVSAPTPMGDTSAKRVIGRVIDRSLARIDLPKKAAAQLMGYADQSTLSTWIAGTETAMVHRLWALGPEFQQAFVIELATACGLIEVQTVLRVNGQVGRTT